MQTLEITRICEDRTIKKVRSCLNIICKLCFFLRTHQQCLRLKEYFAGNNGWMCANNTGHMISHMKSVR